MTFILCFIPLWLGCLFLAWAMPKHHRQWFSTRHTALRERLFTLGGWLFQATALTVCLQYMPIGLALVYFTAVLTAAIVLTALLTTYIDKSKTKLGF